MTTDGKRLSVIIITLNEAEDLPSCLASLPAHAEIIVVDSGSTDQTVTIARDAGARVITRAFTNYSEQKNAAIDQATCPWIFSIDADETVDPPLRDALERITQTQPQNTTGYTVRRRLWFMGQTLRFGKTTDRPLRLFARDHGRFTGAIHEHLVLSEGIVARINQGCLLHKSYADLSDYFARFNRYTSMVAQEHLRRGKKLPLVRHLLRPWIEFVTRYFLRLGFLDGYAGYVYALNSSLYAFIKYAKAIELQGKGDSPNAKKDHSR
jgi:glycosyltransferase involved in cell wall biosynthesis